MPKTRKAKKKITKVKTKTKTKSISKSKEANKGPIKISKTYIPKDTEKYMCEKHKVFFRIKLLDWKKELVRANNKPNLEIQKFEKKLLEKKHSLVDAC